MLCWVFFFFQAEDGIRDLVRSRGLGDVYKRQGKPAAETGWTEMVAAAGAMTLFPEAASWYMGANLSLIHI